MSRARPLLLRLGMFALAGAGVVGGTSTACSGTSASDTIAPITGVLIRAETLTKGRGCGRSGSQVFKYAAVVLGRSSSGGAFDTFVAGNVYDCFSDGQFVELPVSGGSFDYSIQIYAYNEPAYVAAGDAQIRFAASGSPANLAGTNPTFTTTCQAVQLDLVQSLAVCEALKTGSTGVGAQTPPAAATVVLGAGTFPTAEASVVTCDREFVSVRYRTIVSGTTSEVTQARCSRLTATGLEPLTITVSPALAPASYVLEVALLRGDGTVLGQTTCGAETSPGLTSTAVCKPIQ